MKSYVFPVLLALTTGCISRAPTQYELDRRGGFANPSLPASKPEDALQGARFSSQIEKMPMQPVRVAPLVEKIWVFDQQLGPAWLQGSWMFIEVQPAQWFDAIDPGAAPFVFSRTAPTPGPSTPEPHVKTKKKKK
jgi:hypothetical protein